METADFQVTEAERQMIEILREWQNGSNYRLVIEFGGGWEIDLSEPGTNRAARGVGETFNQAWERMNPWWA
jgi:hypothetical protein